LKKKVINFHLITNDKNTGYGKASSNMMEAFIAAGATVNPILPGRVGPSADIDFFLRPPPWNTVRSRRKIAYFYWEAMPLPAPWAASLNTVDEIWAPCKLVEDCCRIAGFNKKIFRVPTPATSFDLSKVPNAEFTGLSKESFIFYSISQWHNRKGWSELLNAYFDEFSELDGVSLVIKTNPVNSAYQHQIPEDVRVIKSRFGNKKTAPLVLIPGIISEEDLLSIHKSGHCYVAPHHGEGWGMPIHDAILARKQIIATKFGGVTEYLDDSCFYPIPFSMVPVSGMEWNGAYNSGQMWAQPDVESIKKIMRSAYENKNNIKKNMLINKNIEELTFDSIVSKIKNLI
jgi:glycosyltransferase involved in cell wall biosynthesis